LDGNRGFDGTGMVDGAGEIFFLTAGAERKNGSENKGFWCHVQF
jgi:hypothetical protein